MSNGTEVTATVDVKGFAIIRATADTSSAQKWCHIYIWVAGKFIGDVNAIFTSNSNILCIPVAANTSIRFKCEGSAVHESSVSVDLFYQS